MRRLAPIVAIVAGCLVIAYIAVFVNLFPARYPAEAREVIATSTIPNPQLSAKPILPQLDKEAYDKKLLAVAGVSEESLWYHYFLTGTTTGWEPPRSASTSTSTFARITLKKELWPVKAPYPNYGALLPFNRIVSYYGNFYSKQMGVLGEYERSTVIAKLKDQIAVWEAADPTTPVIPAINYIAITAQASAGKDGMYRLRMPDSQVDIAYDMAKEMKGILFLEYQVGKSTVEKELPIYEDYLKRPDVHVAIDPEFSMKGASPPGTVIGTFNATDINAAVQYLDRLVRENNLPPKILLVHRFTENMVTGYQNIKSTENVQVVMVMDGWGHPARKFNTYAHVIASEPVQFTGFKLFYHADLREKPPRLLTPAEVLGLNPKPVYIQYQ